MAWQQICLFQVFYVKLHEASSGQLLPILQVCAKSVSGKTSLNALCGNSWMYDDFFPPFHLKQNATDSSSNSSQKREQPVRTLASPASCEHRRICTRGHLHDHYSSDHYHLEQVRFLPCVATSVSARAKAGVWFSSACLRDNSLLLLSLFLSHLALNGSLLLKKRGGEEG